jgi:PAS domain S-box-containing protein
LTEAHEEHLLAEIAHLRARLALYETADVSLSERLISCLDQMLDCFGIFSALRDEQGRIADFRVDYLNRAAALSNGLPLERQLGQGLCEILPSHRTSGLFDRYRDVTETGRPLDLESVDYEDYYGGRWLARAFEIRAWKLGDGFAASWRDITGRKRQEERLTLALDSSQTGIWEWDPATDGITWSPQCFAILGMTPAELDRPLTLEDFRGRIHPEDAGRVWSEVERALRGESGFHSEFRVTRPDGSVGWISNTGMVVRNEQGEPAHMVGTVRDVTERVEARKTLSRTEQALRESEEWFRLIADSIPHMVWSARGDGGTDYYNSRFLDYLGVTREGMGEWTWVGTLHPDDAAPAQEAWRQAYENDREYEIEYRIRRAADGRYLWHLGRAVPLRDSEGRILRWFGTCTDIDEQKRTERELHEARRAAEEASRAKDQFLAVLSHELRTPLTPVLTVAQMLETDAGLGPKQREWVEMIRRNVELETRLIDDLLDHTRISRGKVELHLAPTDLHGKILQTLAICESDARGKRIEMVTDLRATRCWLLADPARLQQVLWNLVKNGVKFTPEGGTVTVRTADAEDGGVVAEVRDSGMGIDPERLPWVFDAFEQGGREVTRMFGGLGLGLAISKGLVELHGGTLTAASDGRDRGAVFTVRLPASVVVTPEPGGGVAPDRVAGPGPGRRLLVVEDHPDTLAAMAQLLEMFGYTVRTADSVASALQVAEGETIDVVVSDIGLPDGSGLDLMRQLLARQPVKGIALSGFGMEEDLRKSREAGFLEHLTKPVDFDRLQQALARVMAAL